MTQKLTNPDGSYFLVDDTDNVTKQKPRTPTDDDKMHGWYRDPNGWWKNPEKPLDPISSPPPDRA